MEFVNVRRKRCQPNFLGKQKEAQEVGVRGRGETPPPKEASRRAETFSEAPGW